MSLILNTCMPVFSEMLEHIERKLFWGGKPINSTISLINEDYRLAGEVMVMSILQGGPAPTFLDPCVYKYLTKQSLTTEGITVTKYKEAAEEVNALVQ